MIKISKEFASIFSFKNRQSFIYLIILVVILVLAVMTNQSKKDDRPKASSSGVDLSISPTTSDIQGGQEATFNISINTHAHQVTIAQLELTFNNTLFDFVSIVPSTTLKKTVVSGVVNNNKIDVTLGIQPNLITSGSSSVYEFTPFTGTGILAVLKLRAKTGVVGNSQIIINRGTLPGDTIILAKMSGDTNVLGVATGAQANVSNTSTIIPTISPTPSLMISLSRTPTPSKTPTPSITGIQKPGDATGDGIVDGRDYVVWLNHFDTLVQGPSHGDFNNNGKVDGIDYVIWLNNYLK